ncbi:MAG: hypothetical protein ACX930_01255 [Erythrobacter sp.]
MSTDFTPETTDPNPSETADDKRDALRQKIEASERRIAERTLADQAREAADAALDYTKENPLKVVGGAVAVGVLIGLMTAPGRRAAGRAATGAAVAASGAASAVGNAATGTARSVSNAASKGTSRVGTLLTDTLIAYGMKLIDDVLGGARAGQDKLEDLGDSATTKARELRRDASYIAGSAADKGRAASRRTRRRAERAVRDLTDRVRS